MRLNEGVLRGRSVGDVNVPTEPAHFAELFFSTSGMPETLQVNANFWLCGILELQFGE